MKTGIQACVVLVLISIVAPIARGQDNDDAQQRAEIGGDPGDGGGRVLTWIAGGLAVAATAGTIITWAAANGEYASLIEECSTRLCTASDVSGVDTLVTLANVGIATSIGLYLLTGVLFFVEGSGRRRSGGDDAMRPEVAVGVGVGSVTLRGRF